jgi:hypothetical protein
MDIRDIYRLLGLLTITAGVAMKWSAAEALMVFGGMCTLIGWLGVKPK